MKFLTSTLFASILLFSLSCQQKTETATSDAQTKEPKVAEKAEIGVYELRTYYVSEGKLDDLLKRFRDHTMRLFEKHGAQNIAYWVPEENELNQLIYIIGHESRDKRNIALKAFSKDPEWVKAKSESGKLVDSIKNVFLKPTDFSPAFELGNKGPRVFEMRTYYTNEGKLSDLHDRFRDHTMKLFEKHSMTNIVYFDFDKDQEGAENTLLYLITHTDSEQAKANWKAFVDDPDWKAAYESSRENGPLVNHLNSVFLKPVGFSPLK